MNKKTFKEIILEKYPKAHIFLHQGHELAMNVQNVETAAIQILGCDVCYGQTLRIINDVAYINNQQAPPISAISEDDSYNPLLPALFLCPVCSKMLLHPDIENIPIPGRIEETSACL